MRETDVKNIISSVYKGSIAEEVGIEVGDQLLKINNHEVEDIIEYKYYLAEEYLEVEILKANGEHFIAEIDKDYDEDLGIEFENPIIDNAKSCRNKCVFCFIDQLPPNMRETLYFKDDDSRLSFLQGNYITLTNMSNEDIEKIIKYRISPINISVHTTNGDLRKKMLNNKFAGNILEILQKFAENNIHMNCQIVLCPNLNDRDELDKTINDLSKIHHSIGSIAVVPVGLTSYREGLYDMKPFNKETASYTVQQVEAWQKKFRKTIKRNLVHVSDEFYVLSNQSFPAYANYEGFPQLENGVGLATKLKHEFYEYLNKIPVALKNPKCVTVVTGDAAYNLILEMCSAAERKIHNLKVNVVCIKNKFFGGHITVSGLITGQDIYNNLKDIDLGSKVIIPQSMMKSDEEIFLDDYTLDLLEEKLGVKVQVSEVEGKQFLREILDLKSNKNSGVK